MVHKDEIQINDETKHFWIKTYLEAKNDILGKGPVTEKDIKKLELEIEIGTSVSIIHNKIWIQNVWYGRANKY